jgi:hypothetical protein
LGDFSNPLTGIESIGKQSDIHHIGEQREA